MSEKDKRIQELEKRVAELEDKIGALQPKELARAEWTHKKLVEFMEPFSDLRNTMTLVNQMQHCINQQTMLEGEMREVKAMLGEAVAEEQEADLFAHLVASLEAAGKSDVEIEAIISQMGEQ